MPELTAIHIGLLVLALVSGSAFGWMFRNSRATRERIAVNAGWQEQLESQQSEHGRLVEQCKGLMDQISQSQVTHNEAVERTRELSRSLNESMQICDRLRQQMKESASNLHDMTVQRDSIQSAYDEHASRLDSAASVLAQKDKKIAHLKRELGKWHSRLPPLVEKFSIRNQEASELEAELEAAMERIRQLEELEFSTQTRVEPLNAEALPDGLAASNEPHAEILAPENPDAAEPDDPATELSNGEDEDARDNLDALEGGTECADAKDDLQQIKGIGPAIEKTLNDLGICRFDQLAEMSEHEIDRVAQRLKGFRSRIYREDWLGQARDLRYQKSKNPP